MTEAAQLSMTPKLCRSHQQFMAGNPVSQLTSSFLLENIEARLLDKVKTLIHMSEVQDSQ